MESFLNQVPASQTTQLKVDINLASTISKPTTTMITTALLNSETPYSKPLKLRVTLGNLLHYVNYCLIKVHIFALTRHGSFSVGFLQSLARLQNLLQYGQCLFVVTFTPLSPDTQSDCVYTGSSTKIKWDRTWSLGLQCGITYSQHYLILSLRPRQESLQITAQSRILPWLCLTHSTQSTWDWVMCTPPDGLKMKNSSRLSPWPCAHCCGVTEAKVSEPVLGLKNPHSLLSLISKSSRAVCTRQSVTVSDKCCGAMTS